MAELATPLGVRPGNRPPRQIGADVELIPMKGDINAAEERTLKRGVTYRFVIDSATPQAEHAAGG